MGYVSGFATIGSADLAAVGGKAANLGELVRAGLPVPPGFVVTTAAYDAFVAAHGLAAEITRIADTAAESGKASAYESAAGQIAALFGKEPIPDDVAGAVREAYALLAGPVAVRSSATAEDLEGASFAGQQDTFLNVQGADAVLDAVRDCWASLWTARAMAYRARRRIAPGSVSLAVVLQELVAADAAGVMFTANPANGRRDEIAIGAAWGLGEAVVGGLVSTDDLVVRRPGLTVSSRRTADKAVMTVLTESGTREQPVPEELRKAPVLDDATAVELARLGVRIEQHYGAPQDVEWARAGGELFVLQARPITALPEPVGEVPTSWPLPYPDGFYFRGSIVEQLPEPLSPLFADMVDGAVSRSVRKLLQQVSGREMLGAGDVRFPAINGYAYYYYRTSAMARLTAAAPALIRMLFRKSDKWAEVRGGVLGWRERSHPRYRQLVDEWRAREPAALGSAELLDGAGTLLEAGCEYYTAVQSIIPLAALSEIYFGAFYNRAVRRPGDPAAQTFLLGGDSVPIRAEKSLYALAEAARGDDALVAALATVQARDLLDDTVPAGVDPAIWRSWRARFDEHLRRFGHTVYTLDFSAPVPADDPAPLLDTIRFYLAGHGTDPAGRQRRLVAAREESAATVRARLDPVRRRIFEALRRRAAELAPIREDALADVGLAWPVMRRLLAELGRRLVDARVIGDPADVYWLRHAELRAALSGDPARRADDVARRRARWRGQRLATPPQLLPESGWWYKASVPFMPGVMQVQDEPTISGVAGSAGQVTGPARVLAGPSDFATMRPGEVLVARMTTPAWTSLFAMASAVVTDIGGPLSHSSIVAREYGIPAVLGTGTATSRIRTGQLVKVDGDAGTVTLLDEAAALLDEAGGYAVDDGAAPAVLSAASAGRSASAERAGTRRWVGPLAAAGALAAAVAGTVAIRRSRRR